MSPRYVVRRGYHTFEEALSDVKREFPNLKDVKITEVPARKNEHIFEYHYKISMVLSAQRKKR